jgi:hypothetical protein
MLKVERKMKVLLLVAQFAGVVEVLAKLCCFFGLLKLKYLLTK